MTVCKFWTQGNCRFGNNCKFEHPSSANRNAASSSNLFLNTDHFIDNVRRSDKSNNRFVDLDSPQSTSARSDRDDLPYNITERGILIDLKNERPQWIFSAYGPGLKAPAQLFGGPLREQSFEEMRLQFYLAAAEGNPHIAIQQQESMYRDAEQQIQNVISDIPGAIRYILEAEKAHPNRLDVCNGGAQSSTVQAPSNPFGQTLPSSTTMQNPFAQPTPSQPSGGAFGTPAALGQRPNPFGNAFSLPTETLRFGATPSNASGTTAFGQASNLGQNRSPFGMSSQNNAGTFGQPSVMGSKPNPFATNSASQSAFGQSAGTAFSKTSRGIPFFDPFGTHTVTSNVSGVSGSSNNAVTAPSNAPGGIPFFDPFGTHTVTPNVSGASGSSNNADTSMSALESNPFGNAQPPPKTNPFGQPVPHGGSSNILGFNPPQTAAQSSPFGSSAAQNSGLFGHNSTPSGKNPFLSGSQASTPAGRNPFGSAAPISNPLSPQSPLHHRTAMNSNDVGIQPSSSASTSTKTAYTNDPASHVPLSSYASKDSSGRLTMFKGRRVHYRDDTPGVQNSGGTWAKIWMPDGAPSYNKDTELNRESDAYKTPGLQEAYETARNSGIFNGGIIPLVPPLREWCAWDF